MVETGGSRAIISNADDQRYCELYPTDLDPPLSSTGVYPNHNRADCENRDQHAQCSERVHLSSEISFVCEGAERRRLGGLGGRSDRVDRVDRAIERPPSDEPTREPSASC